MDDLKQNKIIRIIVIAFLFIATGLLSVLNTYVKFNFIEPAGYYMDNLYVLSLKILIVFDIALFLLLSYFLKNNIDTKSTSPGIITKIFSFLSFLCIILFATKNLFSITPTTSAVSADTSTTLVIRNVITVIMCILALISSLYFLITAFNGFKSKNFKVVMNLFSVLFVSFWILNVFFSGNDKIQTISTVMYKLSLVLIMMSQLCNARFDISKPFPRTFVFLSSASVILGVSHSVTEIIYYFSQNSFNYSNLLEVLPMLLLLIISLSIFGNLWDKLAVKKDYTKEEAVILEDNGQVN